jgi:hypothetical protein
MKVAARFEHACKLGVEGTVSERLDISFAARPTRYYAKHLNFCAADEPLASMQLQSLRDRNMTTETDSELSDRTKYLRIAIIAGC